MGRPAGCAVTAGRSHYASRTMYFHNHRILLRFQTDTDEIGRATCYTADRQSTLKLSLLGDMLKIASSPTHLCESAAFLWCVLSINFYNNWEKMHVLLGHDCRRDWYSFNSLHMTENIYWSCLTVSSFLLLYPVRRPLTCFQLEGWIFTCLLTWLIMVHSSTKVLVRYSIRRLKAW